MKPEAHGEGAPDPVQSGVHGARASGVEAAHCVFARKRVHRGSQPSGQALQLVLGVTSANSDPDCCGVWTKFVRKIAAGLIDATRDGHCEDVRWVAAERYLDKVVAPLVPVAFATPRCRGV